MGLGAVELIMDINNEFDIQISDEDVRTLGMAGEIAQYICKNSPQNLIYDSVLRKNNFDFGK